MIVKSVLIGFGVMLLCGASWLGVQIGDRSAPVTDALIQIVNSPIAPGGTMQVDAHVFYRRSCHAYVTRKLYDNKGKEYPAPEYQLPPGPIGLQHSASTIAIPSVFARGEGRMVSSPVYGCNWFQNNFWPIKAANRVASFMVSEPPVDQTK